MRSLYAAVQRALVPIAFVVLTLAASFHPSAASPGALPWTLVNGDAAWERRAGLQVLSVGDRFYLMGGRTARPPSFPPIPGDSDIWGDVWVSDDRGASWEKILDTDTPGHWPARAYFEAVKKEQTMFVLGGQNFLVVPNPDCPPPHTGCLPFLPASEFFSDVWASRDGVEWRQMTEDAGWHPRAGLTSVVFRGEIYVFGGSFLDDPSIIGGPPVREYFNDVWKSRDGAEWVQLTDSAPWAPRAGAAAVVKDDYIWLLGGEEGFLCDPFPGCELPYFNDVWRTQDGIDWELVTPAADWSTRPGHKCVVVRDQIVCFGGFGLPVNPMDVWASRDGARWEQISRSPWNAVSPDEIKYDFDVLVTQDRRDGSRPTVFTFGGDRETFDFTDPLNYLRLDNDVWSFAPSMRSGTPRAGASGAAADTRSTRVNAPAGRIGGIRSAPNPFVGGTTVEFDLPQRAAVTVVIHDARGRVVRELLSGEQPAGTGRVAWNGLDGEGRTVPAGVYFARVRSGVDEEMVRIVRLQ